MIATGGWSSRGNSRQAPDLPGHCVRGQETEDGGDLDGPAVILFFRIGPGEDAEGGSLSRRVRVPVGFHGGKFGRIVQVCRPAGTVAEPDLQRGYQDRGKSGPLEGSKEKACMPVFIEIPRAQPSHDKDGNLEGGNPHVGDAPDHIGVEDRLQMTGDDEFPFIEEAAPGRLHPGIGHHDPEGRKGGPERHHGRGKEVYGGGDPFPPEDHDPDEAGLQHEGHGRLVSQHVSEKIAAGPGECAPVGPELKLHGNARDYTDGDVEKKKAAPEPGMA